MYFSVTGNSPSGTEPLTSFDMPRSSKRGSRRKASRTPNTIMSGYCHAQLSGLLLDSVFITSLSGLRLQPRLRTHPNCLLLEFSGNWAVTSITEKSDTERLSLIGEHGTLNGLQDNDGCTVDRVILDCR
jgi:hypothetical protein